MTELEKEIIQIIAEKLCVDESEIKEDSSFSNDLGTDSLDTVELLMEFEKKYGISIPDDKQEGITTVGDAMKIITEFVENK